MSWKEERARDPFYTFLKHCSLLSKVAKHLDGRCTWRLLRAAGLLSMANCHSSSSPQHGRMKCQLEIDFFHAPILRIAPHIPADDALKLYVPALHDKYGHEQACQRGGGSKGAK